MGRRFNIVPFILKPAAPETGKSGQQAAETWFAAHPEATRIRRSVEEIAASGLTLAKLTVAANLLGDLVKG
jgi:glutamate dehydrogenase